MKTIIVLLLLNSFSSVAKDKLPGNVKELQEHVRKRIVFTPEGQKRMPTKALQKLYSNNYRVVRMWYKGTFVPLYFTPGKSSQWFCTTNYTLHKSIRQVFQQECANYCEDRYKLVFHKNSSTRSCKRYIADVEVAYQCICDKKKPVPTPIVNPHNDNLFKK